jgi:hypothetical protein
VPQNPHPPAAYALPYVAGQLPVPPYQPPAGGYTANPYNYHYQSHASPSVPAQYVSTPYPYAGYNPQRNYSENGATQHQSGYQSNHYRSHLQWQPLYSPSSSHYIGSAEGVVPHAVHQTPPIPKAAAES